MAEGRRRRMSLDVGFHHRGVSRVVVRRVPSRMVVVGWIRRVVVEGWGFRRRVRGSHREVGSVVVVGGCRRKVRGNHKEAGIAVVAGRCEGIEERSDGMRVRYKMCLIHQRVGKKREVLCHCSRLVGCYVVSSRNCFLAAEC